MLAARPGSSSRSSPGRRTRPKQRTPARGSPTPPGPDRATRISPSTRRGEPRHVRDHSARPRRPAPASQRIRSIWGSHRIQSPLRFRYRRAPAGKSHRRDAETSIRSSHRQTISSRPQLRHARLDGFAACASVRTHPGRSGSIRRPCRLRSLRRSRLRWRTTSKRSTRSRARPRPRPPVNLRDRLAAHRRARSRRWSNAWTAPGSFEHVPVPRRASHDAGASGSRSAVIRRHRLLELFLATNLDLPWEDVHHYADALEHAATDELIELIADKLGDPAADPHGDPIPNRDLQIDEHATTRLADLEPGSRPRSCGSPTQILRCCATSPTGHRDRRPGPPDRPPTVRRPHEIQIGETAHSLGTNLARAIRVEVTPDNDKSPERRTADQGH